MEPHYTDERATIYHGDCREVIATLPDNSVDAIVTDPPYELGFMGKRWDASGIAYDVELWAECLRVLKPGGHMLAFGGTRTWHRLACAVEDAGFEVRDSLAWLYGSGFPKSLDVSKAIDKAAGAQREVVGTKIGRPGYSLVPNDNSHTPTYGTFGSSEGECAITAPATDAARTWQGWGTALKPAFEPIVVARKPLTGTVAGNVLEWGTGALNIDGCRIGTDERVSPPGGIPNGAGNYVNTDKPRNADYPSKVVAGRWPANVVLDEDQAAALDRQSGHSCSGWRDTDTAPSIGGVYGDDKRDRTGPHYGDTGGASRFFYVAKAPAKERPKVDGVAHPTVKPLTLMRWLCRLVTPPDGVILEPFAGSGTTIEAALSEGFRIIAIEREPDYLPLIAARLERVAAQEPDSEQLTLDASA